MTLHRFYLNPIDKESGERRLEPFLYAFTTDDELADKFLRSRNEDLFVYMHDKVTKEQYFDMRHKFHHKELTKTQFKTRSTLDECKMSKVTMVVTQEEDMRVATYQEDLLVHLKVADFMFENPQVLSLEVNKALNALGFFSIYRWLYNLQYLHKDLDPLFAGVGLAGVLGTEEEYREFFENFDYDELEIFLTLYGNTIRG